MRRRPPSDGYLSVNTALKMLAIAAIVLAFAIANGNAFGGVIAAIAVIVGGFVLAPLRLRSWRRQNTGEDTEDGPNGHA